MNEQHPLPTPLDTNKNNTGRRVPKKALGLLAAGAMSAGAIGSGAFMATASAETAPQPEPTGPAAEVIETPIVPELGLEPLEDLSLENTELIAEDDNGWGDGHDWEDCPACGMG